MSPNKYTGNYIKEGIGKDIYADDIFQYDVLEECEFDTGTTR